jgi:hypothetical protein
MWNDLEAVEGISKVATWLSVTMAFLAGIAGLVRVLATSRVETLTTERKKTPPLIDVKMRASSSPNQLVVLWESKNLIPFECQWTVVTHDRRVGTIPIEWIKIYPTAEDKKFHSIEDIDRQKVIDGYIEIRFRYRSIYAAEMNIPELSGEIVQTYKIAEDGSLVDTN